MLFIERLPVEIGRAFFVRSVSRGRPGVKGEFGGEALGYFQHGSAWRGRGDEIHRGHTRLETVQRRGHKGTITVEG